MILFLIQELPDKLQVELIGDNIWTNILIVLNIITSICAAWFIGDYIEKKSKEYEVKAHIQKSKADKIIKYCLDANSTFSKICLKNPHIGEITSDDIQEMDKLIVAEEKIFINYNSIQDILDFRDYIIDIIENPKNKDVQKEKSFFYKIKKIVTDNE